MNKKESQQEFVNDLHKKVPGLDKEDFELFQEIFNYRDINFQETRRIQFPLNRLVSQIYGNDAEKYYGMTTERLKKLANYRVTLTNNEGEYFVNSLFSSLEIKNGKKDEFGGKNVIAYVSEDVYDDYLQQQAKE